TLYFGGSLGQALSTSKVGRLRVCASIPTAPRTSAASAAAQIIVRVTVPSLPANGGRGEAYRFLESKHLTLRRPGYINPSRSWVGHRKPSMMGGDRAENRRDLGDFRVCAVAAGRGVGAGRDQRRGQGHVRGGTSGSDRGSDQSGAD